MNGSWSSNPPATTDVLLVGSGIMSASLAAMLKSLEPRLSIRVVESTPELAREASDGWNNAGTGHAGLCEISYTPAREADGSVTITAATAPQQGNWLKAPERRRFTLLYSALAETARPLAPPFSVERGVCS